jgi:hypothetical protein
MCPKSPVFYLVARTFTEASAGIRSMHLLCDQLNSYGFDAFLVGVEKTLLVDASLNTPVLTKQLRDQHLHSNRKIISVYDESIHGNPLRSTSYVRWLLNREGFVGGSDRTKGFGNSMTFVYAKEIDPLKPRLFVTTVDYEFFKKYEKGLSRDLTLFYAGKIQSLGINVQKPDGAVEIFRSGPKKQTREELRSLFSQARVLYLAEDSAMALEAAICGCPTVHMLEYFKREPLSQEDGGVGIAMSDDPFHLQSTNVDEDFIERYMATLELRTFRDVLNFALLIQGIINTTGSVDKSRYKLRACDKFLLRVNKVRAGFRNSGIRGILGVFLSHIEFKKRES